MGNSRNAQLKQKAERKAAAMKHSSGQSKYARKKEWLTKNGLHGSEVPMPKPWL